MIPSFHSLCEKLEEFEGVIRNVRKLQGVSHQQRTLYFFSLVIISEKCIKIKNEDMDKKKIVNSRKACQMMEMMRKKRRNMMNGDK